MSKFMAILLVVVFGDETLREGLTDSNRVSGRHAAGLAFVKD
jgi:hypothetical protein